MFVRFFVGIRWDNLAHFLKDCFGHRPRNDRKIGVSQFKKFTSGVDKKSRFHEGNGRKLFFDRWFAKREVDRQHLVADLDFHPGDVTGRPDSFRNREGQGVDPLH